jgi:5-methyltetrahydrofolate--homocysteine methyltransferase
MFDLREGLCALKACKEASDLPVIVSIAFRTEARGGRTLMGASAADCAEQLSEAGADAIGANCGDIDPSQMAELVGVLHGATDRPILAEPNAGRPKLIDGQTQFDMAPVPFAVGIGECLDAGATIVGGCCGTTPDHISAVAELIERRAARN